MPTRSKRQWSGLRATISDTPRASSLASARIVAASRCPAIQKWPSGKAVASARDAAAAKP